MSRFVLFPWPALVVGGALVSCSSSTSTTGGPGSGSTTTGGMGGAIGSGTGGAPGGGIQTYLDASIGTVADGSIRGGVGDASLGDAACAIESRSADQVPLDLYLMLDSSASMTDFIADGVTTKWAAVQKAITSFVGATSSAGLGVGVQYFPLIQNGVPFTCFNSAECGIGGPCGFLKACSNSNDVIPCDTAATCNGGTCDPLGACRSDREAFCTPPGPNVYCDLLRTDLCSAVGLCVARDVCDATSYGQPAVEIATLPGAAPTIVTSVTAHVPDGATPTGPALQGALSHAKAIALANPTHRVIVVLATDGLPTECTPLAIGQVAALATTAAQGTPSIATFVIGVFAPQEMGTAQSNLDALAAAGTTSKAFVINTSQDVTTGFLDALNAIRTTALSCEYGIPRPEAGTLDYSAVNVRFTGGTGQMTTIGYAGSAAGCTAAGGWYYNVDSASGGQPTKVEICPTTCESFKADPKGQVNILFGCQTIPVVR